jgi:hypothetical protein
MAASRVGNYQGPIENYVSHLERKLKQYEELLDRYYHYFQIAQSPSPTNLEPCQPPISQCDPRSISSAGTHPRVGSVASQLQKGPRQWEVELNKFLSEIPTRDSWEKRRQEVGLNSKDDFAYVLATLLGPKSPGKTLEPAGTTAPSPSIERAYHFAVSTSKLGQNSQLLMKTLLFRQLLLASYCEVLVKRGEPPCDVDKILSVGLQGKSLDRYRKGAVWVNRRISELYSCGWGDRGSELFLLCEIQTFLETPLMRTNKYRWSQTGPIWSIFRQRSNERPKVLELPQV